MKDQTEIFENNEKNQEDSTIEQVPDEPVQDVPDEPVQVVSEEPIIKIDRRRGKRKTPISEKQRAILVDNLARGRAKALATRRKNAELKKIAREAKLNDNEKILLDALNKKNEKSKTNEQLLKKIQELENKLKSTDIQGGLPKGFAKPQPQPAKPAPTRAPTPEPKPVKEKSVEVKPEAKTSSSKMSKKSLLKMMRSIR